MEQASSAVSGGVDRIELCRDIAVGGLTPEERTVRAVVALGVPVNVLVRPRAGDFVYSDGEAMEMLESVSLCRRLGVNGIVVGALTPAGDVDMERMRRFVAAARGNGAERRLSVTFHRAFDECRKPFEAFEDVIALGCDRLLTSGTKPTAYEGRELIAELVRRSAGRIVVMPGGGVTAGNLQRVHSEILASEYHGTAIW